MRGNDASNAERDSISPPPVPCTSSSDGRVAGAPSDTSSSLELVLTPGRGLSSQPRRRGLGEDLADVDVDCCFLQNTARCGPSRCW